MDQNETINGLISATFSLSQEEKEKILLQVIREQLAEAIDVNKSLKAYYDNYKFSPADMKKLSDIPPLPVNIFKKFDLVTTKHEIVKVVTSSGTTTGNPSRIHLDKTTSFRQIRALASILKDFIGNERMPVAVIDTEKITRDGEAISARAAAIRGILSFASEASYIMDGSIYNLSLDIDKLMEFSNKHGSEKTLAIGFTYIIWKDLIQKLHQKKLSFKLANMTMIHTGGWKKLQAESVDKLEFNKSVSHSLGCKANNILDMYGMSEEVGVVFIDCPEGNKHVPSFAEIIIRNPLTMEEQEIGNTGMIEIVSALPESYPGQAVLTEDIGVVQGVDDCKCGRKGKYFRFVSRIEKAEVRGCGDTYHEKVSEKTIIGEHVTGENAA